MIVPSSGSFTCPFQYNPVDREWQQETCEAMGLNYITSNGITPGGREVGLEPPTTFTRIVGDGNCTVKNGMLRYTFAMVFWDTFIYVGVT